MIFRGYDIRGIYPKEINRKISNKLGKAFGTFLDGETVVVGSDTRASSKKILKPFIEGVRSTGCEVIFIGKVPNPAAYYYAFSHKIFGAYITASHNPPEYTGIKFFKPNGVSFTRELRLIKEIYNSRKFNEGYGYFEKVDGLNEYKDFLLRNFNSLNGSIALESFGGAGEFYVKILEDVGVSVESVRKKIDENFFGMRPEPKKENLKALSKFSKNKNFGVAYDGDADRSVFVTEKGKVLNGSEVASIFLRYILKRRRGKVILTMDCAKELEKIVKKRKSKVIWWEVGHGFIEEKLVEERAIFAAEQSSHFYFNEFYPFSDGLLATLYMLKILDGRNLSQVMDFKISPIEKFYINAFDDKIKLLVMSRIKRKFENSIKTMNGVRIELNKNEWVLIRASQTMPEINVVIEARNKKRLKELKRKYSNYVKKVIKEVKSVQNG